MINVNNINWGILAFAELIVVAILFVMILYSLRQEKSRKV